MENTTPKRPVAGFIFIIALAAVMYALSLMDISGIGIIPDYMTWMQQVEDGNILAMIAYTISDFGDPTYQKTVLGAALMIITSIVIYLSGKKSTFGVADGSGLFMPMLASQLIASFGSLLLYGHIFDVANGIAFVPTFIAVASFTPAIVLTFGGEWYKVLTASVMGILCGTPFAYWMNVNVAAEFGLASCCAWVTPMIISTIVCWEVCKVLPWMAPTESAAAVTKGLPDTNAKMDDKWFVKRVFCDFSEPICFGNEWAGLMFVLGGVISVFLNPANPYYGDGKVYLAIVANQLLASGIGVFIYWNKYHELGSYNTFVPIASLSPAFIVFYGTAPHVVIVGALVSAIIMPPFATHFCNVFAKRYHGLIGNVLTMLVMCWMVISIFNYVPDFGC